MGDRWMNAGDGAFRRPHREMYVLAGFIAGCALIGLLWILL